MAWLAEHWWHIGVWFTAFGTFAIYSVLMNLQERLFDIRDILRSLPSYQAEISQRIARREAGPTQEELDGHRAQREASEPKAHQPETR